MPKFELHNVTIDDQIFFSAYVLVGKDWNGFALCYFTLEQGRRLCEYLNASRRNRWVIINLADNIIASPPMAKEDAESFRRELVLKFGMQGYYLNSKGEKINPDTVKLEIRLADGNVSDSFYNETSDSFIIHEQVEDDEYEPIEYSGENISVDDKIIHVYPIGSGSWIWSVSTRLN